jgi:hypothetical protein
MRQVSIVFFIYNLPSQKMTSHQNPPSQNLEKEKFEGSSEDLNNVSSS